MGYKSGLLFLAIFEKLSHAVQIGMGDQNWAEIAMDQLLDSVCGPDFPDEDLDELIGDEEGVRHKVFLGMVSNIFPHFDYVALENGVSANMLGRLVGHFKIVLSAFEPANDEIQKQCQETGQLIDEAMPKAEIEIARLPTEQRKAVSEYIENGAELIQELGELSNLFVEMKPSLMGAVENCFYQACRQSDAEFRSFIEGVGLASGVQTFDLKGKYLPKNQRTEFFRMWIGVLGDSVKEVASSIPELHQRLIRFDSDKILSRDEDSLQWKDDHKSLEGVCRALGLSFRKRGRPPAKKIPNCE